MTELTLPGLVDVHTHLRVPGGEHKEDFATGTAAALAGGVTTVLAMPNTTPPLIDCETLQAARAQAQATARCDVGLFAGASALTVERLPQLAPYSVALKIYLNDTFGPLRVDDMPTLTACFEKWPREKLIAMHAEKQSVAVGIGLAAAYDRAVHFCHISRREEIELIAAAKARGLPVTCEVAPHHLFLSEADARRLGPLGDMRPVLGTKEDVAALWDHLAETVDCIATDHAPHTLQEKQATPPPPGVPGLETSLPLMLTAVAEGRLDQERLAALMSANPRRIFGLAEQEESYVEAQVGEAVEISDEMMHSKSGWTPFAGMTVLGRVRRVVLRGKLVYEDGQVLAEAGSGRLLPD